MNKEKTAQINEQSENNIGILHNLLMRIPELEKRILELENKVFNLIDKE